MSNEQDIKTKIRKQKYLYDNLCVCNSKKSEVENIEEAVKMVLSKKFIACKFTTNLELLHQDEWKSFEEIESIIIVIGEIVHKDYIGNSMGAFGAITRYENCNFFVKINDSNFIVYNKKTMKVFDKEGKEVFIPLEHLN